MRRRGTSLKGDAAHARFAPLGRASSFPALNGGPRHAVPSHQRRTSPPLRIPNVTDPRLMISVSGIRGRVGFGLTPEVVARYAAAFGAWAIARGQSNAVVLGRDSRITGPMFHSVTRAALESVGAQVIDIGLMTTPSLQLAVEHHHAAGGLGITASHNPIEWNALKFIGPDGLFPERRAGRRDARAGGAGHSLRDLGQARHETRFDGDALRAISMRCWHCRSSTCRHPLAAFPGGLDACHGAGRRDHPAPARLLGCKVTPSNWRPMGASRGLRSRCREPGRAERWCGVARAPDRLRDRSRRGPPRAGLDEGKAIGEDYTLALATRVVLRHRSGPW
jgi:phosphomannomutase